MRRLNCLLSVLCRTLLNKHPRSSIGISSSNEDRVARQKCLRLNIVRKEGRHALKLPGSCELHLSAKKLRSRHCLSYLNTLLIGLVVLIRNRLSDSLLLLTCRPLRNFLQNLLASQLLLSVRFRRSRLVLHIWKNLLGSLLILLLNVHADWTEDYCLRLARRYGGQCVCTKARLAATRDNRLATSQHLRSDLVLEWLA